MIRRLSLICCAIGVFINVALGGTLVSSKPTSANIESKGEQTSFQKAVNHINLNATEFEEDFELDGDDEVHFTHQPSLSIESIEYYFQLFSPECQALNENAYIDFLSVRKAPFFIIYENFRI